MPNRSLLFSLFCLLLPFFSHAQGGDSSRLDKLLSAPGKLFASLNNKSAKAQERLDRKTGRYLSQLQRREEKLRRKLWKKDSLAAKTLFPGIENQYAKLRSAADGKGAPGAIYSGHLDSLTTSLKFLQKTGLPNSLPNGNSSPGLQNALSQYAALQQKLNAAEQIKRQLQQREQQLKEGLQKLGLVKDLKKYQKQFYYYRAQVQQYRQDFDDPSKIEQKLLEIVSQLPQFRSFFRQNSMLGSLFALPGGSTPGTAVSLAGLQTRAAVSQLMTQRFGNSSQVADQLRSNVQAAQAQLASLKNRIGSLSSGSYGNGAVGDPPSFKPNGQHTKSFGQRLEWGANMQSQKARYYFPVTSDIGLSLGYKLNDQSVAGVGLSYKMGWGRGWGHIHLSSEGVGLRSYVDYKIKGAFYLSGGYELNYHSAFKTIDQLKDYPAWQKSGLIGLSKRYQVSKKLKGEMKLLWDFLSYQQVPRAQALLFRIGYSLK